MKQRIINFLLRSVVKIIIPNDIVHEVKGKLYLGNTEITDQEKQSLNAEAKALQSMRIWSILNETIKQLCYERGWKNSRSIEELNISKAMYSILETQESIVDRFSDVV